MATTIYTYLHNDDLNGSRIVSMDDCMCKLYKMSWSMSSSALVTTPITQKPYFSMALLWFNLQLYRCLKIVLLADAKYFSNAYLKPCKHLIHNVLQSFTEGQKFVRGDRLGTAFLQRNP